MRIVRPLILLSLLTLAAPVVPAQGSDAITKLEAVRTRNPRNVAALRALGVAYYKANRHQDAFNVLDQARRLDPRDGVSSLYAGLSAEALGDLTSARRAYDDYLKYGQTRRVKNDVRSRLVALTRAEAVAAAKAAVANEARVSATPGERRVIAVPPLSFSGADSSLRPLERGMAELLITDLSRSAQLTIVERDRMQALSDEIQLSQSGRVDSATAVRAGKLMQAGRLINGQIIQAGNGLTMNASVVEVSTGQIGEAATANSNTLDQLFAMEKQLVLAIFARLEVRLTPAERQLVDRRPTQNMNAFLAYSRGLQAADDGRFDDAARFFDNARTLDPGFGAASSRFQAAQAASTGAQVSAATIETSLGNSAEGQAVAAAAQGNVAPAGGGLANTLNNAARDLNPSTVTNTSTTETESATQAPRLDQPTSTTSIDVLTRTGVVVIRIGRP
jgi:TolB-like protein